MSLPYLVDQRAAETFDVLGPTVQLLTPVVATIVTRARIAQFFREVVDGPPAETIERLLAVSERYGYWNATPEENAAVGLDLAALAR
jgi:hypothetical protein